MKRIALAFLLTLMTFPALAGQRCYSDEQLKAERLLRLHSELMVITVTCKQGSTGRDLGKAYTGLTREHTKTIQQAEKVLKDYYAKSHGGDGLSYLDTLRTKLANAYGQQVADESAPLYCARRRDFVTKVYDSRHFSFSGESARMYAASLSYDPPCKEGDHLAVAHKGNSQNNHKKTKGKDGS